MTLWAWIRRYRMIARIWRGQAPAATADAYIRHFTSRVAPHLQEIVGHRGAYLLRRATDGEVHFLALTLWDSMETIKAFAGPDPAVAVVEPEGRAALSQFDGFASHYQVAYAGTPAAA